MPGRSTLLLAPGPLLLVSCSWLLVCLLLTPYTLGEVRGGLKSPNKVWNVYMGKRETKNQILEVKQTADVDSKTQKPKDSLAQPPRSWRPIRALYDLNVRMIKYIISRKYGRRGGQQQFVDKPEEDPKKNLLRNIMFRKYVERERKNQFVNTQEEGLKKTLVDKIKFRDWFRLTKRGITA